MTLEVAYRLLGAHGIPPNNQWLPSFTANWRSWSAPLN
jgi:hypothetical protein